MNHIVKQTKHVYDTLQKVENEHNNFENEQTIIFYII